ncbi:MAG: glycosyltransferase [Flavobacteriales bacterium]|nr:glycosyltransferase [Flavobacteriales bacterium]
MKVQKKVIGYSHSGYNQQRNIYGSDVVDFIYKKQSIDLCKVLDHGHFKLKNATNSTLHNFHLAWNNCDLLHYFNGINLTQNPWITSFETILPRLQNFSSLGLRRLQSSSCKQLIAISQCAYKLQSDHLHSVAPNLHDSIMNKALVLHPPQKTIINSIEEKPYSKILTFTLIGADFFRKGGLEIVEAFDYLLEKKYELNLNIVSTMQYGDYASQSTKHDLEKALKIIEKHPNSIHRYNKLPNKEVITLLEKSHVGLLLTYADTYGYSVLEAQACGCAVISTNIRALPEINSSDVGYVIEVPKNEMGNGMLNSSKERATFSVKIKENLIEILSKISDNHADVIKKGSLSLDRIKKHHNPIMHAKELQKVYTSALKD